MYKMMKLDVYDRRILEVLIENSEEQISAIAKKIRLRRENVNYRINRMVKSGLIKEFNTILNERALELSHYVVFVELIKLEEKTELEIIDYLRNSSFVSWIGTSAGRWSLVFDIIAYDKGSNFEKILTEFLKRFGGDHIENYEVLRLNKRDYFASKLIGKEKYFHENAESKASLKRLDNIDLRILSLLNKNSRKTLVEISSKIGLTPNGVNNRIKGLINNGIITGYTISINWKKLGYEWFTIQIKLHKYGEEVYAKMESFFRNHKKVVFYYRYLGGSWDYDIGVLVQNSDELRDFINEFRRNLSDVSKISDVFLTLEEITGYKMPEGVFNPS